MRKLYFVLLFMVTVAGMSQNVNFGSSNQFRSAIVNSNANGGIAYNSAGLHMKVDANNDGLIQLTEALDVYEIRISGNTSLQGLTGLDSFSNLRLFSGINIGVLSVNFQLLQNLETIILYDNFTTVTLSGLPNLKKIDIQQTDIQTLDLTGLPALQEVNIGYNKIKNHIDISQSPNLVNFDARYNLIPSINVTGATSLQKLILTRNQIAAINLTGLVNLTDLMVNINKLTALNVDQQVNLKRLYCGSNQITALNIQPLTAIEYMLCESNKITTLNPQGLQHIKELTCSNNLLTQINIQGLLTLENFGGTGNAFTTLDAHGLPVLKFLYVGNNQLSGINLMGLSKLEYFNCEFNQLTAINLTGLSSLSALTCNDNLLTHLNTSDTQGVATLKCWNNQLLSLNLKNGGNDYAQFHNNPNLQYICVDDFEIGSVHYQLFQQGREDIVELNTYCSADLMGINTVKGDVRFYPNASDTNGPGTTVSNLLLYNGGSDDATTTNSAGQYSFSKWGSGNGTISIIAENTDLFNYPVTSYSFDYNTGVTITKNIKIWSNHNISKADVETVIIPISNAQPGQHAVYKILLKNKGNIHATGTVALSFDDARSDFVSASQAVASQQTGSLSWSFTDIAPFGMKEITFTMNINASDAEVPVAAGSVMPYTAVATLATGQDYTPADNAFMFNQTVLDYPELQHKICLQGAYITPDKVGGYVHYLVRFENTGNTVAQTIVVNDVIDFDKLDYNSLRTISASHDFVANKMDSRFDFIFENINLPNSAPNNTGYVLFKVKTHSTLVNGDTFSNFARVYRDYSPALTTPAAVTKVSVAPTGIGLATQGAVPPVINAAGGTLQLLASILPAISSQDVVWSITTGSELATISNSGLITAIDNGIIVVKAASLQNPLLSATKQITISGQPIPAVSITVSAGESSPLTITVPNGTLQMIATVLPVGASQNVTWSIIAGSEFATISPTGLITAIADGTITVQATSGLNPLFGRNSIPSVSGTVDVLITGQPLGLYDLNRQMFTMYPNPVKDILNISLQDDNNASIAIYNTLGQLVKEVRVTEKSISIDVSVLSKATYFIKINAGKTTYNAKFVKE